MQNRKHLKTKQVKITLNHMYPKDNNKINNPKWKQLQQKISF
jgi:hypothetical protein